MGNLCNTLNHDFHEGFGKGSYQGIIYDENIVSPKRRFKIYTDVEDGKKYFDYLVVHCISLIQRDLKERPKKEKEFRIFKKVQFNKRKKPLNTNIYLKKQNVIV